MLRKLLAGPQRRQSAKGGHKKQRSWRRRRSSSLEMTLQQVPTFTRSTAAFARCFGGGGCEKRGRALLCIDAAAESNFWVAGERSACTAARSCTMSIECGAAMWRNWSSMHLSVICCFMTPPHCRMKWRGRWRRGRGMATAAAAAAAAAAAHAARGSSRVVHDCCCDDDDDDDQVI
jgi:hypothetical protein